MRYLLPLVLILSACSHPAPNAQLSDRHVAFAAKHATEATLTFSHKVEIILPAKPTKAEASEAIESQVQHLFGPMERAEYMAAPKEDHTISNISISRKDKDSNTWEAAYDYEGTIVVEKGPRNSYDVILPNNPTTIFQTAMRGSHNPCTDEHYQTEGDFWYFWSPAPTYPKCKLKEGDDYQVVHGQIERINPESKSTYPEYDRLVQSGEIRMDVFFGMDDASNSHDPAKSKDIGAQSYRALKKNLKEMDFKFADMSDADIRKIAKPAKSLPHVEVATKELGDITLRVQLFFGETAIDENSTAFHYFFRDSLRNASLMIYDGHSGLGGHLDLADIASTEGFKFSLPKDQYQIFFFNSCTSYTYYNTKYFQKKRGKGKSRVDPKGTKNLDIMANGLETSFDLEQNASMAIITAIHDWAEKGKWTSYQKLAKTIDDDNLFSVNGDEDNPTRPGAKP
jgi:hypothetical protein